MDKSAKWNFVKTSKRDTGPPKSNTSAPSIGVDLEKLKCPQSPEDEDKRCKKMMELCKVNSINEKEGNIDTVRLYCQKKAQNIFNSVNSPIDVNGNVPLHLTASQNDHVMTCLLLLKGADPNIANKSGVTPLSISQLMGFTQVANTLIQCGAVQEDGKKLQPLIKKKDESVTEDKIKSQDPALNFQALSGQFIVKSSKNAATEPVDVVGREMLVQSLELKIMALTDAAYMGYEQQLCAVLKPETIESSDEEGVTILMKAAYKGHLTLVEEILKRGSQVDTADNYGNTALVWAALGGKFRVVKILRAAGANVDGLVPKYKNEKLPIPKGQMTPLIAAVHSGYSTIIEYLINEKCDVNLRCGPGKGRSAIMVAAWSRRKQAVQLLLQNKAYVDPDVDYWLTRGILYLKKVCLERNAWIGTGVDTLPQKKELPIGTNASLTASQIRRQSLQDKLAFFTSEDSDIVNEISQMLSSRAGVDVSKLSPTTQEGPAPSKLRESSMSKKRNNGYRQGMNLEKIMGNNADEVLALAEHMPDHGTELDGLWIEVFQCIVQLVMAANKNIKHHYIAIAAKTIHCSAEIVRAIENIDKKAIGFGTKPESFCDTAVKAKIKELSRIISSEFPKQLMLSTRMAIGVWPPPDAVSEMIREAASLATHCRELVLLANTLGFFVKSDKKFEVNFTPFEGSKTEEEPVEKEKDSSLKGGLSYSEYKRQNDLKLIEEMSKRYDMGSRQSSTDVLNSDEKNTDAEFFASLDTLLKQFAGSVSELKQVHDQHFTEEFIKATSTVNAKADTIMEEILNFEVLKEFSDDAMIEEGDAQRLESSGVKLDVSEFPVPIKPFFKQAIEDVRNSAKVVMARGKIASAPWPPPNAATEMLQSTIPCVIAVKRLVVLAKESTVRLRHIGSEERRKRDAWRKECLANERVKQMFQMWESQVISETAPIFKKQISQLNVEELELLQDPVDGIVYDETGTFKKVKGGRLTKLVEVLCSHNPTPDEQFGPAFIMTHHSFSTSTELLDHLFKRYEITPPYGLNQRMFEIYLDKKVVQVRLKVCHVLLYWIQNHFEEDFVDNEYLILRFRDFVNKKVAPDFEHMAVQVLETLEKELEKSTMIPQPVTVNLEREKTFPKPILVSARFGYDPLAALQTDPRAFLEIDPIEMARQLTLVEYELFSKVQAYECLDQIWESRYKKEMALNKQNKPSQCKRHVPGSPNSNISKMIRHTNDFTFWIATCIVNNDTLKARLNCLKYFISLAQQCLELNNLTAVTTIVAGLTMGPVGRLHKTWGALEDKFPKLSEEYKALQELVSPKYQYANYRKCLKEMVPPAIPFLGVFLTDLTFCELGNPDFLPDSHFINFDKRRKVYFLIKEIQKFQQTPFGFAQVPQIQDFMRKLGDTRGSPVGWEEQTPIMNEDELYDKSLEVEPKEASSDDEEEEN
ncbi:hypothetical protein HK103_007242 [Boothiomyces macroporosus]|uniref:Uncharacterized protein n=1 Tax=Boothiomyces macroporosus TaxID=261099 RepID=A0AAD5UD73_9FUNG|nr:hypothetical protein HK103_007242 [Boothiomyces macroporosus]